MKPDDKRAKIESILRKIKGDSRSSATKLVKEALEALSLFSETPHSSKSAMMNELILLLKHLVRAQPSMAPFRTLANEILLRVDEIRGPQKACQEIRETCRDFLTKIEENARLVAEAASQLIEDNAVVLTHSASTLVFNALKEAKRADIRFTVICTESRPKLEGVAMAKELARIGVKTRLVTDSVAFSLVHRSDILLFGSDTVMLDGVVNKVGTKGLAIVSKEEGVPAYVLAGNEKFLPRALETGFRIEEKDPSEVLEERHHGVQALNIYFDVTPFSYLSGVVTENGLMGANEIRARLIKAEVSELMRYVLM